MPAVALLLTMYAQKYCESKAREDSAPPATEMCASSNHRCETFVHLDELAPLFAQGIYLVSAGITSHAKEFRPMGVSTSTE